MEVPGCWRAPLSVLPMTFVPLVYGAIFMLFAPGRHSLCAFVLSGVHKDEVILLLLHAGVGVFWMSFDDSSPRLESPLARALFPGTPLLTPPVWKRLWRLGLAILLPIDYPLILMLVMTAHAVEA
ncbi:hypothetical protein F2Q70_00012267 [Brassica cretica]|uniref:Uncharacterized protein n=1 Tax=Brassica cretica TaxID=69181 RepID=A0A8S9ME68_BRACR|nr:hypothetical protein F2Q70_00012267 [Brassica cretica]